MADVQVAAACSCGAVVLALRGAPIGSFACYCDTCQEGSRRIEALPHAPAVREPDGGTAYVLYRKDRVAYAQGEELVTSYTLEPRPKTNRVVATCCNSAIMMRFDDARHWIPVYRARLGPNAPAIQMRICTSFLGGGRKVPERYSFPPGLPARNDDEAAFVRYCHALAAPPLAPPVIVSRVGSRSYTAPRRQAGTNVSMTASSPTGLVPTRRSGVRAPAKYGFPRPRTNGRK